MNQFWTSCKQIVNKLKFQISWWSVRKCACTSCKHACARFIASARVYDSCARICAWIFMKFQSKAHKIFHPAILFQPEWDEPFNSSWNGMVLHILIGMGWIHSRRSEMVNLTVFNITSHYLTLFGTIWWYLVISRPTLQYLVLSVRIWQYLALSDMIWHYVILHGSARLEKVASGTYRHFVRNSSILMTCWVKYPILLTDIGEKRVKYGILRTFEVGQ